MWRTILLVSSDLLLPGLADTSLCHHPHGYYDSPAAISSLHLSAHDGSRQHIGLQSALSEFILSLPLSIFTEALEIVQHVATLCPLALPAQQDRGWREVDSY